jgi:hypothetical protein
MLVQSIRSLPVCPTQKQWVILMVLRVRINAGCNARNFEGKADPANAHRQARFLQQGEHSMVLGHHQAEAAVPLGEAV